MRRTLQGVATALALLIGSSALAQAPTMPTVDQVPPVRGEEIPLSKVPTGGEFWNRVFGQVWVRNVERASLYVVRPMNRRGNGKAVIVVPGGGYMFVSIDSEGFRVADRLAAQGYTAFMLKYRVNSTPPTSAGFMADMASRFGSLGKSELPDFPAAVDDLAAAVTLVSSRANDWKIEP